MRNSKVRQLLHFAFCILHSYTLPMSDIESLFADYASYHRTKGNKAFHRLGIPLIMLSLIGMLARVHLWRLSYSLDFVPVVRIYAVDAAMLLILAAELYYLAVEWRLAIGMLVV